MQLALHDFHRGSGAEFTTVNGVETVSHYGDVAKEYAALHQTAGVLDLSCRSRLCLTGNDRVGFLHGQVTNDIKSLSTNTGCYSALTSAKGRMQSDLNIYLLAGEVLLDLEPGLGPTVSQRLEKNLVADDVQVVDVAALYGLLSVQGPKAAEVVAALALFPGLPHKPFGVVSVNAPDLGELYLINQPRLGLPGFDLFVPVAVLEGVAGQLKQAAQAHNGCACGWEAFETVRIERGIPRFGQDMDENNFPQESGIEARAISYAKGCYVGQEVLNRIHTMGHVNQALRGLRLPDELEQLPAKSDKLFHGGREVGYFTSACVSPGLKGKIALGYVRKEVNDMGHELSFKTGQGEGRARIVAVPFEPLD